MYTFTLLSLLFTATTWALPRPQALLTGIPSVYIPETRYPCHIGMRGCLNPFIMGDQRKILDEPNNNLGRDLGTVEVKREEEAGVFYCKDVGWGGECLYRTSRLGSAPGDCTMMNLDASSIGPDQGYYCIFYTNAVCAPLASDGSDTLTLSYPGTDNLLSTEKGDFNDRLLSYQCFREEDIELDPEIGTPSGAEGEGKTE